MNNSTPCPACKGSRIAPNKEVCIVCHGTGQALAEAPATKAKTFNALTEAEFTAMVKQAADKSGEKMNATLAQPLNSLDELEQEIRDLLDLANPNTPTGFWRKDRAAEAIHRLITAARVEELEWLLADGVWQTDLAAVRYHIKERRIRELKEAK